MKKFLLTIVLVGVSTSLAMAYEMGYSDNNVTLKKSLLSSNKVKDLLEQKKRIEDIKKLVILQMELYAFRSDFIKNVNVKYKKLIALKTNITNEKIKIQFENIINMKIKNQTLLEKEVKEENIYWIKNSIYSELNDIYNYDNKKARKMVNSLVDSVFETLDNLDNSIFESNNFKNKDRIDEFVRIKAKELSEREGV